MKSKHLKDKPYISSVEKIEMTNTAKQILIIDDDIAVQTSLYLLLKKRGYPARCAEHAIAARKLLQDWTPDLVILDMNFTISTTGKDGLKLLEEIKSEYPDLPVILITGWGTIDLAVRGMQLGARDFISKPWENKRLLQSIETVLALQEPKDFLERDDLNQKADFEHIVGKDPQLLSLLQTVAQVAPTHAPVLITGESGTGKELIAEAIHQNSLRKNAPFIKVNLGGVSSSLFESEMFGHKRGAFTDAHYDRKGRFEMADGGTIFLDEIGDLDAASQVKLLRVLQDQTFEILGSSQTKKIDVRIISATNRNLEEMVGNGTFREDLYYRINLVNLRLPALRERAGDIPLLAQYFLDNLKAIYHRPDLCLTQKAKKWLEVLPLPGNIRQLKNLVERTILITPHDKLEPQDFERNTKKANDKTVSLTPGQMTLEEMEIAMIKETMSKHHNRISKVARALGITRSSLYRRLEKYNIPYERST